MENVLNNDPTVAAESKRTIGTRAAISVMLTVPNASDAIAWYKLALGARELWNLGKNYFAEMVIT